MISSKNLLGGHLQKKSYGRKTIQILKGVFKGSFV
jgi:hypothetical protein